MNNIRRFPPSGRTVQVTAEIPASQVDEFERLVGELIGGERPRMDALDRDEAAITRKALEALALIERQIEAHPGTGGARRLVRFLAGLYNGQDYPFDLTDLRALDTVLANACLDYLNYDRLGRREVHRHLANGDRDLHRWLTDYDIRPAQASS